ncbi:uncharacterized protein SCHCODRAFT_01087954 [Schizophyllum commune H4-8]|uniref:uncharacterized protein n=1 Tax=Schizophyllum commune (strain H4-8 / FGSC 9210) TaxID=578458 RepID=UPI00215F3C3B|nr:uncharacterized protein SCHCODRAFT_01087954 [Schizophyllum commune H4-8]KAI5895298.1 hypothetical protein SCHCODRAFT_01087954 [Schizophyllum commune H4-8]
MVCFQSVASNANFGVPALETGGSWKKSPVTMTFENVSLRQEQGPVIAYLDTTKWLCALP